MKNILLIATAFFSVTIAQAQVDTIRDERMQIPNDIPVVKSAVDKNDDLVLVPNDKLPAILRQALLNELYAGWENNGVHQRKSTGEYSIEINQGGAVKKYRFDEKGQPITGLGSSPNANPN